MRQVDAAALPQPHARDDSHCTRRGERAARRPEHLRARRESHRRPASTSAWCSSARRPSRRCRSATTSPRGSRSRARRSTRSRRQVDEVVERALRQRGAVGRGEGSPEGERDRALRRPAAAPVHRARARDRSARAAARRADGVARSAEQRRRSRSSSTSCGSDMTVVIVTHNMQQAARVSDRTAFMLIGELVEVAPTRALFTTPSRSAHRGLHHRTVRMSARGCETGRRASPETDRGAGAGRQPVSVSAETLAQVDRGEHFSLLVRPEAGAVRHQPRRSRRGPSPRCIGPSGCGKSTFLRSINRLNELIPGARHTG